MKITVLVKTNAKQESVTQDQDSVYVVKVNVPPVDGKANERVVLLLSKHFGKPKSSVKLLHGARGKNKIFEIV